LPVSHFTRSQLPPRFQGVKTQVVPEGVDLQRFTLPAGDTQEGEQAPYLLSVGPIKRRKGYHRTLEAFHKVRARRPDARYRIVGSTDDRVFLAQLEARIAALGLQDAVELLGRVSDEELLRLYHGCAAFWLLPVDDGHQFEGFGLVYWEANACGRPVIGALRSGAEDAIEDGLNGYLVPADDPDAAAGAALRLLDDPALGDRLGAAGRARVRPWEDAARQVTEHYRALLGGGTRAVPALESA
jgi:glycosyltransferase involved in cell wall biosynthesis